MKIFYSFCLAFSSHYFHKQYEYANGCVSLNKDIASLFDELMTSENTQAEEKPALGV